MPAGTLTPPFSAPTAEYLAQEARRAPGWSFTFFVPGHPMPKGSPEPKTLVVGGKRYTKVRDKTEVMAWVAKAAGIARQVKQRRIVQGDASFPYEAPVALSALFVYRRPRTQPTGPPIVSGGRVTKEGVRSAVGDLDKLVRAIGDALGLGTFSVDDHGKIRASRAGVIKDDRLITDFGDGPYKRFVDQVRPTPQPGCYVTLRPYDEEPIDLGRFV